MKKVLVTGATGQLGQCFKQHSKNFPELEFTFANSEDLDLELFGMTLLFFERHKIDICINCAAYTNVEQAESNREMAFLINSDAVKNLAKICRDQKAQLVHFSTDYVFDGFKDQPYSEEDEPKPLNIYGASKLSGEECIQDTMEDYFIFRTSWLYSNFGNNFYSKILKKAEEGAVFNITDEQKGTPTNAHDIAYFILKILSEDSKDFGLYHYSNLGEASWYDFAREILKISGKLDEVTLNKDNDYNTLAVRPKYSVLSKQKVRETFRAEILPWQESLERLFRETKGY